MTTVCGILVYQCFCGGGTIRIGMGRAKNVAWAWLPISAGDLKKCRDTPGSLLCTRIGVAPALTQVN